ncbi:MAG: hypothetical protein IJK52_04485 [Oscillospiraceae bacterium]|nr:hypothetical protein [Oscillospiraceae bacterium]
MSLFEGVQELGLSVIEGITSAAAKITSAFSSPQMIRVTRFIVNIGPALRPLVAHLQAPGPALAVLKTLVADVIPAVARLLLESVPKAESAEELGRKVERAAESDIEPEDFNSTEEYMRHIRENIPDEAPDFFEALDEKERLKYAAVGSGVYARSLEEKYGVTLDPAFWNAVNQSEMRSVFSMDLLIQSLRERGVTNGALLDDFFAGRLKDDPYEYECVQNSLKDAVIRQLGDIGADVLRKYIDACIETYRRNMSERGETK